MAGGGVVRPSTPTYQASGYNPNTGTFANPTMGSYYGTPGANPNTYAAASSAGYQWNPVTKSFERSAQAAGDAVGAFGSAALRGLGGEGGGGGLSSLQTAAAISGIGAGGGGGGGGMSDGGVAPATYDANALAGRHAADFATAKDEAAGTASASLNALRGALSSRGMDGGGYEASQIGNTLSREANTIGAASRSEATDAANLDTHLADENYQGGIAQRGQTLQAQEAERQSTLQGEIAKAQLTATTQSQQAQRSLEMLKMALSVAPAGLY